MTITSDILKKIAPFSGSKASIYATLINNAAAKFNINTALRMQHFIAQLAHESGSFVYTKELASGAAYDTGRLAISLGNTPEKDGDGQKYKGRGLIQITGRNNYKKCSLALFGDLRLIENPSILEQPEFAVASACWFWNSRGLNLVADTDNIVKITKIINGGSNGLNERKSFLLLAKKYIK